MKSLLRMVAFLALVGGGVAAQEGRPAPWALKFTHGALDTHSLTFKDGSARTDYYLTFKLKNTTSQPARLAIHFKAIVGENKRKQKTLFALPAPGTEEAIRRLGRAPNLKNVQQINAMKTLAPGETVEGIAVFGTFDREWDGATILVSGLEPFTRNCRVRKYGDAGFTVPHRAYFRHNNEVLRKAGKDPAFTEVHAIVQHNVVWKMRFHRKGDEFAPQLDPIVLDTEGWDVLGPKIIHEKTVPFSNAG